MEKETIARILWEINAVSLNPVNPFKYASGLLSPIYTDCRVLTSYPEERKLIIDHLVDFVTDTIGQENIDIIVGTAHSGISLAAYLAQRLGLPMAYIRSSAKPHGKRKQIEGILKKRHRVLLLSDIMSTEEDIPLSVEAIRRIGAQIIYCLTIFSNNLGIVEDFLEKERIKYHSLTDLETLLHIRPARKKISPAEKEVMLEWMKSPKDWGKLRRSNLEKMLEEDKERIAKILLKIRAVTLNTMKPYEFVSGVLSPIYTDTRLLISYPKQWKQVIESFTRILINKIGIQNVDIICGTSTAGIPHAAYLAEKLSLPMIYVKSKKDEYGKYTRIEGQLKINDKVLILEDLVSTGKSSISSAEVIREAGGLVENCLAIFTYGMRSAAENFKKEKIRVTTLTDLKMLLNVAIAENYIMPEERTTILEWANDPHRWDRLVRTRTSDLSATQKTPSEKGID